MNQESEVSEPGSRPSNLDLLQTTTELAHSIFRAVWDEFYYWEATYCQDVISSLAHPNGPLKKDNSDADTTDSLAESQTLEAFQRLSLENQEYLEIWNYDETSPPSPTRVSVEATVVDEFKPHAIYESCAPCSRSIYLGDDPDDMPFIPLADDPKFDIVSQTQFYTTFAWQNGLCDPDLESIVLETARRLHVSHGVPLAHIDETGVLPLEVSPRPGKPDITYSAYKRDFPRWPGVSPTSSFPPPNPSVPSVSDLRARLESAVQLFCPNLNCVQPYCSVHVDPVHMPKPVLPCMLNDDLIEEVKRPCGSKCFSTRDKAGAQELTWSAVDLEVLRTVLSASPDLTPCDLAVICRFPCLEVFLQRCKIVTADFVQSSKAILARKPSHRALEFADLDADKFTPNEPCHHDGPCNDRNQCPCYSNKAHCQRNCRCALDCNRRWRGCRCARVKGVKTCTTTRCPCFVSFRECDPELCLKCEAKCLSVDNCQNSHIRQGRNKGVEVKESHWGLGAFLTEPAEEGDLVSEYTGELIYEPTCDSRDEVAKHRHRNYVFGLNSTMSLDASFAGNESRFINHVPREMANCRPCVRLVNDEHRIGIFASKNLEAGSEILFDYGPCFFKDHNTSVTDAVVKTS